MVEKYLDKQGAQALANAINSKQSELTFDSTPTADSTNPVTSGGIKTYVDAAINNLPEPMVFKGTLGTGGTITSLPAAAASNEGHTYKVITEITSPSIAGETITLAQAHAVENFDFNKVTTLNFTNDYNPATAIFVNYDPSSTERMLEMEISGNASQIKFKKVDDLYVAYPGTGMNRMFEDTGAPSYNLNKSRLKTMLLDIAKQTGELEIGLKPTTITAGTPLESIYEDVVLLTLEGTLAKVGDTVISNGSSWVVIPSGDEPSGTVTSVGMTVPTGLSVSGSPVTTSGTLAVSYANGYSIPTTAKQTEWDKKMDVINLEEYCPHLLQELMPTFQSGTPVALSQTALSEYRSLDDIEEKYCKIPSVTGNTLYRLDKFNRGYGSSSGDWTYPLITYFNNIYYNPWTDDLLTEYDKPELNSIMIVHTCYEDKNYINTENNDYRVVTRNIKLQDKIGWDTTPTVGSSNAVRSSGIKTYVDDTVSTAINNIDTFYELNLSNLCSSTVETRNAACNELETVLRQGEKICTYGASIAVSQSISPLSSSETNIGISFFTKFIGDSFNNWYGMAFHAYRDSNSGDWTSSWVNSTNGSLKEHFKSVPGSINTSTGVISGQLYDTFGSLAGTKLLLHLNNGNGITSASTFQLTADQTDVDMRSWTDQNPTTKVLEGPIYVIKNGQYARLEPSMINGEVDLMLRWAGTTASSTTGTWYCLNLSQSHGTLNTTNTTAQSTNASESLGGTVNLHKIAKTGTYGDLIGTPNYYVGNCTTAAATVAKSVSYSGYTLKAGNIVSVKFTYGNTGASPTLNINSTGAKPMKYLGAAPANTIIKANDLVTFVYDGTNYNIINISSEDNHNLRYGFGFGTCSTAANSTTKTVTLSNYELVKYGLVAVRFEYGNTAGNISININSKGSKTVTNYDPNGLEQTVYCRPGDAVLFSYSGSSYEVVGVMPLKSPPKIIRALHDESEDDVISTPNSRDAVLRYVYGLDTFDLYDGQIIAITWANDFSQSVEDLEITNSSDIAFVHLHDQQSSLSHKNLPIVYAGDITKSANNIAAGARGITTYYMYAKGTWSFYGSTYTEALIWMGQDYDKDTKYNFHTFEVEFSYDEDEDAIVSKQSWIGIIRAIDDGRNVVGTYDGMRLQLTGYDVPSNTGDYPADHIGQGHMEFSAITSDDRLITLSRTYNNPDRQHANSGYVNDDPSPRIWDYSETEVGGVAESIPLATVQGWFE